MMTLKNRTALFHRQCTRSTSLSVLRLHQTCGMRANASTNDREINRNTAQWGTAHAEIACRTSDCGYRQRHGTGRKLCDCDCRASGRWCNGRYSYRLFSMSERIDIAGRHRRWSEALFIAMPDFASLVVVSGLPHARASELHRGCAHVHADIDCGHKHCFVWGGRSLIFVDSSQSGENQCMMWDERLSFAQIACERR